MTQFVSTSNQANNVTIQRDHLVESQKIFFRNRTKPLVVLILPHLFSHLSFFIFIWKIWLQRERERVVVGLLNLLFQCNSILLAHSCSFYPCSLLCIQVDLYVYSIFHLRMLPFFRFSFPACLSQLPRRLSGCFSATCTPARCSTGKKDEFITRDTDENIKQTARSYNLFLLNVLNIFLRSSAFSKTTPLKRNVKVIFVASVYGLKNQTKFRGDEA